MSIDTALPFPVAEELAAIADIDKSVALILSPLVNAAAVDSVAVAVPPDPPPPESVTVGTEVYPVPAAVTLIPIIVPVLPRTATAVAPEPEPPVIATVGVVV